MPPPYVGGGIKLDKLKHKCASVAYTDPTVSASEVTTVYGAIEIRVLYPSPIGRRH